MKRDDITILPDTEFEQAAARSPGELGAEVMAQVRDNGRIQDHFRVVVGGSAPLELEVGLGSLFTTKDERINALRAQFLFWPRDITMRRNAVTSAWVDTYVTIAKKNAMLVDKEGAGVPTSDMAAIVDNIEDVAEKSSSYRWAVVIGDDGRLQLHLQSLPASERFINGRPGLRR